MKNKDFSREFPMPSVSAVIVGVAVAGALVSLGGAFYEYTVVDPRWPGKLELIQPKQGGIDRKHFWIPAHVAFELMLILSLVRTWRMPVVRSCLLAALASHVTMRLWSGFDFIPKALEFERATAETFSAESARAWTKRSLWRLPLDLLTCTAMFAALISVVRDTQRPHSKRREMRATENAEEV